MASVLARILAALRGVGIPAPGQREPGRYQPQVRRVATPNPRNRDGTADRPSDRAAPRGDFRVRRMRQIAAFYADGTHEAVLTAGDCAFLPDERFRAAAELIVRTAGESSATVAAAETAVRQAIIKRRLGELPDRERATLRAADLLCELGEFERAQALRIRLPIIWNGGRCRVVTQGYETATRRNFVRLGLESLFGEFVDPAPEGFAALRRAWRNALSLDATLSEEEHQTLASYQFIERAWRAPGPDDDRTTPAALTLGLYAGTDRELRYDDSHGLITFAPAQSDRHHRQIAENLARLAAGALVIDLDGKAFHATARFRQREIGPIFAFAPALPDHSMHYNPLDAIGRDPEAAWGGARLLADLLTGRAGPDEEIRNFVAPAIFDVALDERRERRQMHQVVARIACAGPQLETWLAALARSPHRELVRHGAALRAMPQAERKALASRVMGELAPWQAPPIADLTDRSDWTPADLRRRATLYLCIERRDIDRYAPVLRTIVGQAIAALSRDKAISPGATVTLFLDGLAHLGPMATIARAVDIGPEYGVRPWMFFASGAEMAAVYPDAEGMAANCAAHCYAGPHTETAQELALRLGFVKSLFGAAEKPMVAAADLDGPAFADIIVALVRGHPPAKLTLPGETTRTPQRRR